VRFASLKKRRKSENSPILNRDKHLIAQDYDTKSHLIHTMSFTRDSIFGYSKVNKGKKNTADEYFLSFEYSVQIGACSREDGTWHRDELLSKK